MRNNLLIKVMRNIVKTIMIKIVRIKDSTHYSFLKSQGDIFVIFDIWWHSSDKCHLGCTKNFSIINYKKAWKLAGNKPRISFYTNGGKRKNGDWCFDAFLTIGYTIINYTNFDLQRRV